MKFIALLLTFLITGAAIAAPIQSTGTIEVFFSPKGGATEAVVRERLAPNLGTSVFLHFKAHSKGSA